VSEGVTAAPPRAARRALDPILVALVVAYVASRVIVRIAGVYYDATPLSYYWQYLDPALLRHDLLRSLWWLHAQPPVFNAYLGIVLHLPQRVWSPAFEVVAYAGGLALLVGLDRLLELLGIPRRAAAVVAIVVVCAPSAIVYEQLLFYPHFVAAALVVGFALLGRYLQRGSRAAAYAGFAVLGLVVLTRSSYHVVWLIVVACLIASGVDRSRWREVALCALLPVVISTAWMAKNEVQFGTFSTSSWIGINAARVTLQQADRADLGRLVAEHRLSPVALIPPFSAPGAYPPLPAPHGVPALDETAKRHSTEPNFNQAVYPRVSRQYLRDAIRYARARPRTTLANMGAGYRIAFSPAEQQPFVFAATRHLGAYDRWFSRFVLAQPQRWYYPLTGAPGVRTYAPHRSQIAWTLVALYLLATIGAVIALVATRRTAAPEDRARRALIRAMALTVAYAVLVGQLFELGENSRFRYETDALAVAVASWVVSVAWSGLRARRQRTKPSMATAESTTIDGSAAARNRT
jgi:hypothetical protein